MDRKYRVIFYGVTGDMDNFKAHMAKLGASPAALDMMLKKAPVILKQNLEFEKAVRYADAVSRAGGNTETQAHGFFERQERANEKDRDPPVHIASFKDFIMCPQCGLKQHKNHFCAKCGHRLIDTQRKPKNVAGH